MNRRRMPPLVAVLLALTAATAGCDSGGAARPVTITIHHSAFDVTDVTVPAGVPVTFVLVNEDPIDHEWLVGDVAFHDAHRTGTHAVHAASPTEVTVPALETVSTTITFESPGRLAYICHLPQHEAYGMVGTVTVEG
jgi:plastocyanin